MKVIFALLTLVSTASASIKPQVSVSMTAGDEMSGNLGGLEPNLKWFTSGSAAGFDFEGGIDLKVKDVTAEVASFPTSVWGKAKRNIAGLFDVSALGYIPDVQSPEKMDIDLDVSGYGTTLKLETSVADSQVQLNKIQVSKSLDALGGSLKLTPKYDFGSEAPNLQAGYTVDNTSVEIDAAAKKVTVAHSFLDSNKITPSVSASGDFSLSYSKTLETGTVTTTWKPDDSLKVEWNDGDWKATFTAPVEGLCNINGGIKVGMQRNLSMP